MDFLTDIDKRRGPRRWYNESSMDEREVDDLVEEDVQEAVELLREAFAQQIEELHTVWRLNLPNEPENKKQA